MLNNMTYIISCANPLQYMMTKTYHNLRMSKWLIVFFEFDLEFISQKSIKGQVIANQLAEAPLLDNYPLNINLPNKDIFVIDKEEGSFDMHEVFDMLMYFDISKCDQGGGV